VTTDDPKTIPDASGANARRAEAVARAWRPVRTRIRRP
jgi:hypothetical protein